MMFIIFISLLLVAFLYYYKHQVKITIIEIIIFAFIVRLIFVFLSNGISNFDLDSYHLIGELTLQKYNIYPTVAPLHHPYFPVFLYLEAIAMYIQKLNISYVLFLKTIFIIFDVGVVYMLYILSYKNLQKAFLYAINPISASIVAFHGQFDSIPIFLILLSYFLTENSKNFYSAIFASLAIVTKTWPILFAIPVIKRIKIYYVPLLLLFPILSVLVYHMFFASSIQSILWTIYSYRGISGNYGLGLIIQKIPTEFGYYIKGFSYGLLLLGIIFIFVKQKITINKEVIGICLLFFALTLGFGVQWFLWLIPFLILMHVNFSRIFILLATSYIGITYFSWITKADFSLYIQIFSILTWLSILLMTFTFFYKEYFNKMKPNEI